MFFSATPTHRTHTPLVPTQRVRPVTGTKSARPFTRVKLRGSDHEDIASGLVAGRRTRPNRHIMVNVGSWFLGFLLVAATTMLQHAGAQTCSPEFDACSWSDVCIGCNPYYFEDSEDIEDFDACVEAGTEYMSDETDQCKKWSVVACCMAAYGADQGWNCLGNYEFSAWQLCMTSDASQRWGGGECTTLPCYDYAPIGESQDSGDATSDSVSNVGGIVGGVVGGVVILAAAAVLAVMWKTGRLQDVTCGGGSGEWLSCCRRSKPAAVTGTSQPPTADKPAAVTVSVTDQAVAGAPAASASKPPPLPRRASAPTTTGAPSSFAADRPLPLAGAPAASASKPPPLPRRASAPTTTGAPAVSASKPPPLPRRASAPTTTGAPSSFATDRPLPLAGAPAASASKPPLPSRASAPTTAGAPSSFAADRPLPLAGAPAASASKPPPPLPRRASAPTTTGAPAASASKPLPLPRRASAPTTAGAPSSFAADRPLPVVPPTPDSAAAPPAHKTPAEGWAKQPDDDEEESPPTPNSASPLPVYKTPAKDGTKHPADDQE